MQKNVIPVSSRLCSAIFPFHLEKKRNLGGDSSYQKQMFFFPLKVTVSRCEAAMHGLCSSVISA